MNKEHEEQNVKKNVPILQIYMYNLNSKILRDKVPNSSEREDITPVQSTLYDDHLGLID